ncbi:MAG: NnrS family protein [Thiohalomonadaceae bacterium]
MNTPSLWKVFSAAPHRVMFFAGVAQLMFAMLLWGVELSARYTGLVAPLQTVIPITWAHAWLMLFGVFTFLMFGFLMTTYPRWMNGPLVPEGTYVRAFAVMVVGALVFYAGLLAGPGMVITGVIVHALGFALGVRGLYVVYRAVGATRDRRYETQLNVALVLGIVSELAFAAWIATDEPWLLQAALRGALWLFLIPVLVLVAHRMLPFFSSSVIPNYTLVQPRWTFPVLWASVAIHFVLETFGALQWLFLADVPLLFLAAHHSLHWGFRRSLAVRLLAALHIAFAFLSVGLALYVIQSFTLLLTGDLILGRAPLHAIAIGFVAAMVIGMITRVSRGHSGRPLVMDGPDWTAFLLMLGAAVMRIAGDVQAIASSSPVSPNLLAALAWLAALIPWGIRYLAMYLRPRIDGKPG